MDALKIRDEESDDRIKQRMAKLAPKVRPSDAARLPPFDGFLTLPPLLQLPDRLTDAQNAEVRHKPLRSIEGIADHPLSPT